MPGNVHICPCFFGPDLAYLRPRAILSKILPWLQIILSVILILAILLQQSAAGLGGALGGSDSGATYHTKRGLEKFLFYLTIVVAILFAASAFIAVIIR